MCVGDFGEGGDEGRVDDVFVDYIGENTESGYGGYRKHLGIVLFAQFNILEPMFKGRRRSGIVNSSRWGCFSALRYRRHDCWCPSPLALP